MQKVILLISLIALKANAAPSYGVGQKNYTFTDKSRSRTLSTYVWYPTEPKVNMVPVSRGGHFVPVISALNAPLAKTPLKFPVVLLSHGSGGKADKLFWLTDRLVHSGIVVLAVDHPGNMTNDNSADGMMQIWERPKDLIFVLNRLEEIKEFKTHLDLLKVGAAGHSAGGTTALLLGGARLSASKLTHPVPNCAGAKDPYFVKICEQLKSLDLKKYPKDVVEGDYSDRRVNAIVGLDPGMAQSFDTDSLKNLRAKSYLFIADQLHSPQEEIFSKDFLQYFPSTAIEVVPKSFHMTFLQACKPGPQDDLELKELCLNTDEKLKIQNMVAEKTVLFFKKIWGQ